MEESQFEDIRIEEYLPTESRHTDIPTLYYFTFRLSAQIGDDWNTHFHTAWQEQWDYAYQRSAGVVEDRLRLRATLDEVEKIKPYLIAAVNKTNELYRHALNAAAANIDKHQAEEKRQAEDQQKLLALSDKLKFD